MLRSKYHRRKKYCDADNKQHQFHCVNQFIKENAGFANPFMSKDKFSPEFLITEYLEIYLKILQHKFDEELKVFGCLIPNCVQKSWHIETIVDYRKELLVNSLDLKEGFYHENRTRHWITMFTHDVRN